MLPCSLPFSYRAHNCVVILTEVCIFLLSLVSLLRENHQCCVFSQEDTVQNLFPKDHSSDSFVKIASASLCFYPCYCCKNHWEDRKGQPSWLFTLLARILLPHPLTKPSLKLALQHSFHFPTALHKGILTILPSKCEDSTKQNASCLVLCSSLTHSFPGVSKDTTFYCPVAMWPLLSGGYFQGLLLPFLWFSPSMDTVGDTQICKLELDQLFRLWTPPWWH